jgi:hypothetical protein
VAHHEHFRNLLHVNKLEAFKEWVQARGYIVHPTPNPEKNIYECLRIEEYTPSGNNPHLVFYKRDRATHISIPRESTPLVREFVDQNQSPGAKRRREQQRKRRFREREAMRNAKHTMHQKPQITKDRIEAVLDEVEEMKLPDGAYWMMCHEKLGLEYGDLFPLMEEHGII